MQYVCAQLDTATQTCLLWAEYSPILPPLTSAEADQILIWFVSLLLVVFTFKQLKRFF